MNYEIKINKGYLEFISNTKNSLNRSQNVILGAQGEIIESPKEEFDDLLVSSA